VKRKDFQQNSAHECEDTGVTAAENAVVSDEWPVAQDGAAGEFELSGVETPESTKAER